MSDSSEKNPRDSVLAALTNGGSAVTCLNRVLRARDLITSFHTGRVGQLAALLAAEMGYDSNYCVTIDSATTLHDIGKMVVPLEIIQKPTMLSEQEILIIQAHSAYGHDILAGTGDSLLDLAAEIALYHHERYDGTGYPDGLAGDNIPTEARIVAICDVYDALRRDRPYRRGMSHDDTMSIIIRGDDRTTTSSFDPAALEAFLGVGSRVDAMYEDIHLEYGLIS